VVDVRTILAIFFAALFCLLWPTFCAEVRHDENIQITVLAGASVAVLLGAALARSGSVAEDLSHCCTERCNQTLTEARQVTRSGTFPTCVCPCSSCHDHNLHWAKSERAYPWWGGVQW
jgi:hypothetical protein